MKIRLMMLGLLLLLPLASAAQEIEAKVVRYGANLYEIVGRDLFIATEYCFEGAEQADILLKLDESGNQMQFKKSGNSCDIQMVYGRSQLDPGEYNFAVSRDDEGWYGIDGQDAAFKTTGCYSFAENVAAKIIMEEGGKGSLVIPSEDEECRIEGVYGKTELQVVKE
ncbi:MAG: hypothetical protein V2I50_05930 [Desulfuromusa sp.]|jgi:hypothetical protein|nr:hypothetical protein [Desulfuromusa sp.]